MTEENKRPRAAGEAKPPDSEEIRARRQAAGLTQSEAAGLVHAGLRAWQKWEGGERQMHPAFWELFQLKTHSKQVK